MMRALQLLIVSALATASQLTLLSPKLSILSPNAPEAHTEQLSLLNPLPSPVELGQSDTLKLNFQIAETGSESAVQPHQVFLRLHDLISDEEGIIPLRVSSSGKVKFELNLSRPPLSLPPTSTNPLTVTLILGSFSHSPAKWHLFDLKLPPSLPLTQHVDEPLYHPLPNISHTFRPDHKQPPRVVSAVFSAFVVSPWLGLLLMLFRIPHKLPNILSLSVLPFLGLLLAFEVLLFRYWIGLKLGEVLLYGSILGVATLGAGKNALTALSIRRLGNGT